MKKKKGSGSNQNGLFEYQTIWIEVSVDIVLKLLKKIIHVNINHCTLHIHTIFGINFNRLIKAVKSKKNSKAVKNKKTLFTLAYSYSTFVITHK